MSAQSEFESLIIYLGTAYDGKSGQMFGKKCIKINSKATVALYKEFLVFKLQGDAHAKAIALSGSSLWDPSAKQRHMKEWVQIPLKHKEEFKNFAKEAAEYVGNIT